MIYMVPVDGPPCSPRLIDNFLVDDEVHNSSLVYQATAVYQARYQWKKCAFRLLTYRCRNKKRSGKTNWTLSIDSKFCTRSNFVLIVLSSTSIVTFCTHCTQLNSRTGAYSTQERGRTKILELS
jgi:hypothetical protein